MNNYSKICPGTYSVKTLDLFEFDSRHFYIEQSKKMFAIVTLLLFCFVSIDGQYVVYYNFNSTINVPSQTSIQSTRITTGTRSSSAPFPFTTERVMNPIYTIQPALSLPNSNCFCTFDALTNLLTCSPGLKSNMSNVLPTGNRSIINMTLNSCRFSNNHLNLFNFVGQRIDLLILADTNQQDYLVFDRSSFESYRINQMIIYYTVQQRVTILLMSDDTFSSLMLRSSLISLRIESCYLLVLPNTFRNLENLRSIILVDIDQFSWSDFQREIRPLTQLRSLIIQDETKISRKNIANVLSCNDFFKQWTFVYRSLQTCSCELISFLKSLRSYDKTYQCLNSLMVVDLFIDRCELNGKEYLLTENNTSQYCSRCLNSRCSPDTVCIETTSSSPTCVPRSRLDYEIIRQRVPPSPLTNKFLFRETQAYLNFTGKSNVRLVSI